jgi:hypothetical protein
MEARKKKKKQKQKMTMTATEKLPIGQINFRKTKCFPMSGSDHHGAAGAGGASSAMYKGLAAERGNNNNEKSATASNSLKFATEADGQQFLEMLTRINRIAGHLIKLDGSSNSRRVDDIIHEIVTTEPQRLNIAEFLRQLVYVRGYETRDFLALYVRCKCNAGALFEDVFHEIERAYDVLNLRAVDSGSDRDAIDLWLVRLVDTLDDAWLTRNVRNNSTVSTMHARLVNAVDRMRRSSVSTAPAPASSESASWRTVADASGAADSGISELTSNVAWCILFILIRGRLCLTCITPMLSKLGVTGLPQTWPQTWTRDELRAVQLAALRHIIDAPQKSIKRFAQVMVSSTPAREVERWGAEATQDSFAEVLTTECLAPLDALWNLTEDDSRTHAPVQ